MCECPHRDPCVWLVVSECSLNLVVGQVFVGTCSVDFFSDLYYQGTNTAGYIVFVLCIYRWNILLLLYRTNDYFVVYSCVVYHIH